MTDQPRSRDQIKDALSSLATGARDFFDGLAGDVEPIADVLRRALAELREAHTRQREHGTQIEAMQHQIDTIWKETTRAVDMGRENRSRMGALHDRMNDAQHQLAALSHEGAEGAETENDAVDPREFGEDPDLDAPDAEIELEYRAPEAVQQTLPATPREDLVIFVFGEDDPAPQYWCGAFPGKAWSKDRDDATRFADGYAAARELADDNDKIPLSSLRVIRDGLRQHVHPLPETNENEAVKDDAENEDEERNGGHHPWQLFRPQGSLADTATTVPVFEADSVCPDCESDLVDCVALVPDDDADTMIWCCPTCAEDRGVQIPKSFEVFAIARPDGDQYLFWTLGTKGRRTWNMGDWDQRHMTHSLQDAEGEDPLATWSDIQDARDAVKTLSPKFAKVADIVPVQIELARNA